MSLSMISSDKQAQFYEKSYLAGAISFVVGRREDSGDRDPMLRLHECLATITVKKKKGEVIACHIAAASGSPRRSELHMSKNDVWGSPEKAYVVELLKIFAEMSRSSSQDTLKSQLRDKIYIYCAQKVQHRIDKMLSTIESVQEDLKKPIKELFPHDDEASLKQLKAKVELLRASLSSVREDLKSTKSSSAEALAAKSNSCREWARKWDNDDRYKGVLEIVREKFPYIDKRLRKVASYSRSIDVLSEWAAGVGEYRIYKDAYPVPADAIYSTPLKVPTGQVMKMKDWEDVAKKHYPNDATQQNLSKLRELNPFLKAMNPPKELYLHAEMHVVRDLLDKATDAGKGVEQYYIGISKLCCYLCYNCIRTVNEQRQRQLHINVKGTHNKLYNTWLIPSTISPQELQSLEGKVDSVNKAQLKDPKQQENGTDESAPVSSQIRSLAAAAPK